MLQAKFTTRKNVMNKFVQAAFAVAALSFTAFATAPASAAISIDPSAATMVTQT
jgi:hypothetical protein